MRRDGLFVVGGFSLRPFAHPQIARSPFGGELADRFFGLFKAIERIFRVVAPALPDGQLHRAKQRDGRVHPAHARYLVSASPRGVGSLSHGSTSPSSTTAWR